MTESNSIPQEPQCRYLSSASELRSAQAFLRERTCHGKDVLCRTESIGVVHGDRKPDEAKEKVEHDNEERKAEHSLVPLCREVISRDRHEQHGLGDRPDERAPFDVLVSDATGKVDPPNGELGHDVVRCGLISRVRTTREGRGTKWPYLTIAGGERHPSRGRPPGDDKAKEPGVLRPSTFGGPYIDGAAQRQRRANFGEDGGGDEHKDHGYEVGRPGRQNSSVRATNPKD